MNSNKSIETGDLSAVGTLTIGKKEVRKYRNFKVVELASSKVPTNPFYLSAEVGCTLPIAEYTMVKASIGIKAPIDITDIEIAEAYKELEDIAVAELDILVETLVAGLTKTENEKNAG